MKLNLLFQPLRNPYALKRGVFAFVVAAVVYGFFAVVVTASIIGFTALPIANLLLFSTIKTFSTYRIADWVIFGLIIFSIGLLFANYAHWKCKSKTGQAGLLTGLIAATCPACILPALGIAAFTTAAFRISVVLKLIAFVLIIMATYMVASRQQKCST